MTHARGSKLLSTGSPSSPRQDEGILWCNEWGRPMGEPLAAIPLSYRALTPSPARRGTHTLQWVTPARSVLLLVKRNDARALLAASKMVQ